MWNGSDWVAMAAIAAGAAGSVALYAGLVDRSQSEVRTIVVDELRSPIEDGPPRLRLHRPEPAPQIHVLPPADDLSIRHVPYVILETERDVTAPPFDVEGRRYRIDADGRAVEIEKRRDRHPDRKRRRRDRP